MFVAALAVPLGLLALLVLMERLERSLSRTLAVSRVLAAVDQAAVDEAEDVVTTAVAPLLGAAAPTSSPATRRAPGRGTAGVTASAGVLLAFAAVDVTTSGGRIGALTNVGIVTSALTFVALVRPRRLIAAVLPVVALLVVAVSAALWQPGLGHVPARVWGAVIGDDVTDASAPLLGAVALIAGTVVARSRGTRGAPRST